MLSPDQFHLILVLLFWRFCSLHYFSFSVFWLFVGADVSDASASAFAAGAACCIDCRKLLFYGSFAGLYTQTLTERTQNARTDFGCGARIRTNRQWDFIVWNIICWKFSSSFTFHFRIVGKQMGFASSHPHITMRQTWKMLREKRERERENSCYLP